MNARSVVRFFYFLLRNLFTGQRFIRLSVNEAGNIYFYDRQKRRFFNVLSRNLIDSTTAEQIFTRHDYGFAFMPRAAELRAHYERCVAQGKPVLIIDCGANIGLAARYFAEEYEKAQIVAVELNAENCAMIEKNCGHLGNVTILNKAIGSSGGFASIADENADSNAFQAKRDSSGGEIEIITIGQILESYPGAEFFIGKIDIEGFERDLFQENTGWVDQTCVLIVETHDWMLPGEASSANFLKAISGKDRDFIINGENVFSISNSHIYCC
ncbi:MAG: FkbM family methyltransferase [Gammaproteobacteria bacterium]|nr:FkbM family methyltransferase [Gammaproteobacteria bacterium]